MATKTLAAGAITLASPSWSGGAIEDTNDLEIVYDFGLADEGLDQSALTDGANSLYIRPSVGAGQIGSIAAGPLIIDIIDTFSNEAPITVFLRAGGDDSLVANANIANGQNHLDTGAFTNITQSGGSLSLVGTNTNFVASGGASTLFAATKASSSKCMIFGGTHTIRRLYDEIEVYGGTVIIDIPDGTSMTSTALRTFGGTTILIAGAFPTIENKGGVFNASRLRVSTTPGATSWTFFNTRFYDSTLLVTTNRQRLYGSTQVASGPTPL